MSTVLQSSSDMQRLAILGKLDSSREREELLQLLAAPMAANTALELVVYDADTLPLSIIQAIDALLDRGIKLKIVAYHTLLTASLARLGLPVRQIAQQAQNPPLPALRAVALGGSAESLDKILFIVERLPLAEIAVFVVQHIKHDTENLLDGLLKVRTEYRVVMPLDLMVVQPRTIYVAPPGHHMKVSQGRVYLTRDRKVQYARPSIDALFESLADEYKESALAILLCGYGKDGVAGCASLKANGACVLVEDSTECNLARAMPDSAREAGHFDHILKAASIASVTAAVVGDREAPPANSLLSLFLDALSAQYGYNLQGYERASLSRRIANVMGKFGYRTFCEFQRAVLTDGDLFDRLLAELSVGVTEFFRHPEQLFELRSDVLPYLASFPVIKAWSAGCSTGEEAYSLAILLEELGLQDRSNIFATDVNVHLIALAECGLFPKESLPADRENYQATGGPLTLDAYLSQGSRFLTIDERLRKRILFHRHALGQEGTFNEFQLIFCRNVMIYFDADMQRKALSRLRESLHKDGFLVLGPRDGLTHAAIEAGFVPHKRGSHIYRHGEKNLE